jgi:hypothetical protein
MKQFLNILLFLTYTACYSQSGVRVYLEKPNQLYKQTTIFFLDNEHDKLNDTLLSESYINSIWTTIDSNKYAVNCFEPLIEDVSIPINIHISSDTGLFIIGVDEIYGKTLPCALLDNQVPGYHLMPYYCQGPISNERFSIYFERPIQIEVLDDCDFGYIVIDNDEPSVEYTLLSHNDINASYVLPTSTDTIFDLPRGDYTLCVNDYVSEQIVFTISNTVIDATLFIPYTTVYIGDSYITPVLNIYSPYTDIYWDFGDGTSSYNDTNPVHYYTQPGTYTLKAILSERQCSRIFESQILVENTNGNQTVNKLQYKPTSNYYIIDGKLVRRL